MLLFLPTEYSQFLNYFRPLGCPLVNSPPHRRRTRKSSSTFSLAIRYWIQIPYCKLKFSSVDWCYTSVLSKLFSMKHRSYDCVSSSSTSYIYAVARNSIYVMLFRSVLFFQREYTELLSLTGSTLSFLTRENKDYGKVTQLGHRVR